MDIGTALVTTAVAAVALLPRIPSLSAAGRAQAQVRNDVDLWHAMPKSVARDALERHIEADTTALLEQRGQDRSADRAWMLGSAWLLAGWLMLLLSMSIETNAAWAPPVRTLLLVLGMAGGTIGVVILGGLAVTLVLKGALWLGRRWLLRRKDND